MQGPLFYLSFVFTLDLVYIFLQLHYEQIANRNKAPFEERSWNLNSTISKEYAIALSTF